MVVTQFGEPLLFWEDLSTNSHLVEGAFNTAPGGVSGVSLPNTVTPISTPTNFDAYYPQAKLGHGNYVVVWGYNEVNYFTIEVPQQLDSSGWELYGAPGMTVAQASAIDKKVDDGLPQYGRVQAFYVDGPLSTGQVTWSAGGGVSGNYSWPTDTATTAATAGSPTTCYDNNSTNGTNQQYSMTQNNGANVNCALSFQFQAGD
jgi:hypothetical protein